MGRGWTKISAPEWPTPVLPRTAAFSLYQFAADPTNADHLLYSNGHAVMLTLDGGCTWTNILSIDPSPAFPRFNGAVDRVLTVHIHGDYIYIHVAHQGAGASVIFSHDLGKTMESASVGFPPPGGWSTWIESLDVAPSDPKTVYFAIERNVQPVGINQGGQNISPSANLDSVYASTDGGKTWSERSLPTGRTTTVLEDIFAQVVVDARDPNTLWAHAQDTPTFRSTDGGNNWAKVTALTPEGVAGSSYLETFDAGTFSSIVAVPHGAGVNFLLRSDDGGQSFYKIPVGVVTRPAQAAFAGSTSKLVAVTFDTGSGFSTLLRLDLRSNRWVDISPPGVDSMHGLRISKLGTKTAVFIFEPAAAYRYTGRL